MNTSVLKAGRIQGEGSLVSGVQTKLEPSSWDISHTNNHSKLIRKEKVMAPQSKGVKNSRKQTIKHYKIDYWTPKFIFLYDSLLLLEFQDDL